jgi:hypothetical protein
MYDLLGLLVASRFDAEADSVWLEGSIHNAGSDRLTPKLGEEAPLVRVLMGADDG